MLVFFDRLPVEAVFNDPVGVVAVEGTRVQELEDHAFHELRIAVCECFPVLENIAPVALVVQDLRAVFFVVGVDGELIPRAAGVAVAAAELERQVFNGQSL